MIRYATENDKRSLISLWQEAFGDSEEYILKFLDSFFNSSNTPVVEADGEIAAMLFLLDGSMSIGGRIYPAYYLYAACTQKKYRGRGFMSELLKFSAKEARKRGRAYICLKPGEKSLFDFYAKHGYLGIFGRRSITVERQRNEAFFEPCEQADLFSLRETALHNYNYFVWERESFEKAISLSVYGGARIYSNCKGYSLYSQNDDECTVMEFTFTDDYIDKFANYIFSTTPCKRVRFSLISTGDADTDCECNAMALPLNEDAKRAVCGIVNAYLGLTLE